MFRDFPGAISKPRFSEISKDFLILETFSLELLEDLLQKMEIWKEPKEMKQKKKTEISNDIMMRFHSRDNWTQEAKGARVNEKVRKTYPHHASKFLKNTCLNVKINTIEKVPNI